jgi:hypothetical protein
LDTTFEEGMHTILVRFHALKPRVPATAMPAL